MIRNARPNSVVWFILGMSLFVVTGNFIFFVLGITLFAAHRRAQRNDACRARPARFPVGSGSKKLW
jgi:hypothetical protein